MRLSGRRYLLQRRHRKADPWTQLVTSDHIDVVEAVFQTERRVMRYGEVQVVDTTTDAVVRSAARDDKPEKGTRRRPEATE